jgi:hypothetical protein
VAGAHLGPGFQRGGAQRRLAVHQVGMQDRKDGYQDTGLGTVTLADAPKQWQKPPHHLRAAAGAAFLGDQRGDDMAHRSRPGRGCALHR